MTTLEHALPDMRPAGGFALILTLLLLLCAGTLTAATASQPPTALHSVQADFVQEKHLKILSRPLISTGSFTFQAPNSLRWEYRTPVVSILLMHDGKVRKFVQREGRLTEEPRMQLDAMQVVLAEISNWLKGHFTENKMFAVSFPGERTILLTPKTEGMAAMINRIELTLADRRGLLDAVTIFEGPDSFTRLTFSKRKLNEKIPVSVFTTP